jgi:hypothetical protein
MYAIHMLRKRRYGGELFTTLGARHVKQGANRLEVLSVQEVRVGSIELLGQ